MLFRVMLNFMNKKEQELPLAAFVKVAEILLRKEKQLKLHKVHATKYIKVCLERSKNCI